MIVNPTLNQLLNQELKRQQNSLELIASENYTSPAVIAAYSNVFTNKYSEWYPWARYYGGNEVVDDLENYTKDLALQIFWLNSPLETKGNPSREKEGLEEVYEERGVNVQALSGSVANLAVYTWVLKAWATILAMDLSAGWHLTHGMKLNASGKYFNIISYGVKADGTIDYDQLRSLALEHKPAMIVAWFSSYPRSLDRSVFQKIKTTLQDQWHTTLLLADIAHIAWLVAGKVIEWPFDHGFDIITTTTHKTLRWPRGALIYYRKDLEKQINRGVFPGVQWWPFDHVLVAKATSFLEILDPVTDWSWYCQQVLANAKTLAAWLVARWWSVATWDTENHIVILDVTAKSSLSLSAGEGVGGWGLTGKIAEKLLEDIGLSTNKQLIPNDPRPPLDPSWVRLGTPAITTRWLIESDIEVLVDIIDTVLTQWEGAIVTQKARVLELCHKYPLPY